MDKLGDKDRLSSEDVLWFTSKFIHRMRQEQEVYFRPTCRQAISIPSLLSSRHLRSGLLTPEDLVLAAVATSQPEDQATAHRVAMDILSGEEEGEKESKEENEVAELSPIQSKSGSGISSGAQLVKEWWERFHWDKEYRRQLMAKAEKIVLRSESRCEYTFLTKEALGPIEGEILSPFWWGDDPDLIDFEESLENLMSQGKKPSQARYEDLIVRQRRGQRKAVVFLQDISGSMDNALRYSLMYGAILLYALRRHELALAFFEGNDYIIKQFFDKQPIEEVVEAMLSASSMRGTMGEGALKWAREQLGKIDGRYYEKECIIFSDFGFFDSRKVAAEIKKLARMDVKVIIILPPVFIYRAGLEAVGKTDYSIVELDAEKMTRFTEIMSEAI